METGASFSGRMAGPARGPAGPGAWPGELHGAWVLPEEVAGRRWGEDKSPPLFRPCGQGGAGRRPARRPAAPGARDFRGSPRSTRTGQGLIPKIRTLLPLLLMSIARRAAAAARAGRRRAGRARPLRSDGDVARRAADPPCRARAALVSRHRRGPPAAWHTALACSAQVPQLGQRTASCMAHGRGPRLPLPLRRVPVTLPLPQDRQPPAQGRASARAVAIPGGGASRRVTARHGVHATASSTAASGPTPPPLPIPPVNYQCKVLSPPPAPSLARARANPEPTRITAEWSVQCCGASRRAQRGMGASSSRWLLAHGAPVRPER